MRMRGSVCMQEGRRDRPPKGTKLEPVDIEVKPEPENVDLTELTKTIGCLTDQPEVDEKLESVDDLINLPLLT